MKPSPLARDPHALYEAAVQGVDYDLTSPSACSATCAAGPRARCATTSAPPPRWRPRSPCATPRTSATASTLIRGARVGAAPPPGPARAPCGSRPAGRGRRAHGARAEGGPVLAYNFSYWVFKTRDDLRGYFRAARRGLKADGLFVVNAFGGTDAMRPMVERRRIPAKQAPDGWPLPRFRYVWEQESFNPIDHAFRCAIHFEFDRGRPLRRAFSYDWRFWTLPEIREDGRSRFPRQPRLRRGGDDETSLTRRRRAPTRWTSRRPGWRWWRDRLCGRHAIRRDPGPGTCRLHPPRHAARGADPQRLPVRGAVGGGQDEDRAGPCGRAGLPHRGRRGVRGVPGVRAARFQHPDIRRCSR